MDILLHRWLVALLLLPIHTNAQSGKSLLWKLSHSGETSGYLYGSVHLADAAFTAWPESVTECFSSCTMVAGELNLLETDGLMSNAKLMLMKDSMLHQMYAETDYQFVKSALKNRLDPMTYFMVDRIKPFFTLATLYEGKNDAKNLELVPDYRIQQWAKDAGKEVTGLETFSEQIAVIDALSYREQAMILLGVLKEKDEFDKMTSRLKELYLSQDIEALLLLGQEDPYMEQMEASLLTDRNVIMAHRLQRLLHSQKVFCVVGAAHLAGESGMIRKLESLGFTVEPVYFEFR